MRPGMSIAIFRVMSKAIGLAGLHARWQGRWLEQAIAEFKPRFVGLSPIPAGSRRSRASSRRHGVSNWRSPMGLIRMVQDARRPTASSAPSSARRACGTWAAPRSGQDRRPREQGNARRRRPRVTGAGPRSAGTPILPVDSEHSAIFQASMRAGARKCRRVILTSSGGPFRGKSARELAGRHTASRRCSIRPGRWARRSRSTRPP